LLGGVFTESVSWRYVYLCFFLGSETDEVIGGVSTLTFRAALSLLRY
jgi:hypothetical protein